MTQTRGTPTIADDLASVLRTVGPLVAVAAGPFAPVAMALAGVLANVVQRRINRPDADPVDPVLAASVLVAMKARNADTLATCSAVEARELAHQEYLRQKIARTAGARRIDGAG